MFARIAIAVLLSILGACSGGTEDAEPVLADAGTLSVASLQFDNGSSAGLLPNTSLPLVVHYTDLLGGSNVGIDVEFALTGSSAGASLSPSHAQTDENGEARTTLQAGSTTGDLQVRARAANGVTAYTTVTIGQALTTELAVTVSYQGARSLATYTVTSLPGMTCSNALSAGVSGDVSYTFDVGSSAPVSFQLGSGITTAIVGFGRDASNGKLASGCQEYTAPITADANKALNTLTLALSDQPLRFDNALSFMLEVALGPAAQRLSDSATSAVTAALTSTDTANVEAEYYLDAIAKALLADTQASAALASQRAGATLATALTAALSQAHVGPKAVGAALGTLLTDRGANLTVGTSYQNDALGPITGVGALSGDGHQTLALQAQVTANMIASFSADSAEVRIASLSVDLPLGSYGVAVLDAVRTESASATGSARPAVLESASGCSAVLGPWWTSSGLASVCDAATAVSACQGASDALVTQVEVQLHTLDTNASKLEVDGSVQTESRADEGQVDDFGPSSLTGKWGSDSITAQVTMPLRNAFSSNQQ